METCAEDGSAFGACEGAVVPASDDCATPADEDCDGSALVCPGGFLWSTELGGTDYDDIDGVAVDADGNVYVAGYFQATADFGGGPLTALGLQDIYLVKLDPAGQHLWSRQIGNTGAENGVGVAVDADGNVVVAGEFGGTLDLGGGALVSSSSDAFVASYDPDGDHRWSRRFGGPGIDGANDVAADALGQVYVAGSFQETADLGGDPLASAGSNDAFVVALDAASGDVVWRQRMGGSGSDVAIGIDATPEGDVAVAGYFQATASFGGDDVVSAGDTDGFVAALDAAGTHAWSRGFGGPGLEFTWAAARTADGGAVVVGNFEESASFDGAVLTSAGDADGFVVRFDGEGSRAWLHHLEGDGFDDVTGVAVTDDDHVVVVGELDQTVTFAGEELVAAASADGFAALLDGDGQPVWITLGEGTSLDHADEVTLTPGGDVVVGGMFFGSVSYGGPLRASNGDRDAIVVQLQR